jgi:hypothetical protein
LSPSSVSNNVKETYGVSPGSSTFLAYVTRPHKWRVRWGVWKNLFYGKEKWGGRFCEGKTLVLCTELFGDTRLSWLSSDYEALIYAF